MKHNILKFTTLLFGIFALFFLSIASALGQKTYYFKLHDDIGPNAWRTVKIAFENAESNNHESILLDLNTFGGMVNFADSIRTKILDSDLQTIVYINHNAASAGALISLAADKIYMSKGSSIGAASMVDQSGEILPEKYQSYMRGLMRATAEAKGRDPKIAEAFVDPEISIPELKPDGKILTLTSKEAAQLNLINGEVNSIQDIYTIENIQTADVTIHKTSVIDKIIGFLINPAVSGILIILIIGGIYFELQTPGVGFALIVSITAAILFFAPLYLQGLAENWEIALFFIGVILIILEILVIPGFGVPGILGIIAIIAGLSFSLVANDKFDFNISAPGLLIQSMTLVVASCIGAIILMVIFGKSIMRTPAFKRLVLQDEQRADEGFTSSRAQIDLLGREGIAKTVLRPSGKIEIDGKWYDAVALDGFIDLGEEIYVEKHENYNLFVRKKRIVQA